LNHCLQKEREIKSLIEKITNQEKIFNDMRVDIDRLKILIIEIYLDLEYKFNFEKNVCVYMDEEGYCKKARLFKTYTRSRYEIYHRTRQSRISH
jgi:hypothetical protein